jgi:hypothetical protein
MSSILGNNCSSIQVTYRDTGHFSLYWRPSAQAGRCGDERGASPLNTKKSELPEYGFRWWDIGGGYEQIKGERAGELRKV